MSGLLKTRLLFLWSKCQCTPQDKHLIGAPSNPSEVKLHAPAHFSPLTEQAALSSSTPPASGRVFFTFSLLNLKAGVERKEHSESRGEAGGGVSGACCCGASRQQKQPSQGLTFERELQTSACEPLQPALAENQAPEDRSAWGCDFRCGNRQHEVVLS